MFMMNFANSIVGSSLLPPWRGGDITRLEVATEYSAMDLIAEPVVRLLSLHLPRQVLRGPRALGLTSFPTYFHRS